LALRLVALDETVPVDTRQGIPVGQHGIAMRVGRPPFAALKPGAAP
jgi:hypothetical protein